MQDSNYYQGLVCGITGASGVIGRALIEKLLESGAKIRAFDIRKNRIFDEEKITYFRGDILDFDSQILREFVKGCDIVFHLAAKMPQAHLDRDGFFKINVEATKNLLKIADQEKIKRFVFASSTEVYGAQFIKEPLKEDDEKIFTGPYSKNKYEVEQLIFSDQYNFEATALRMPMVFGPGFYHEKSILSMFFMVKYGLPIPIPAPKALVSFVASPDVASAFFLAARSEKAPGQAFNIAAADYPKMIDFFHELTKNLNSRSRPFSLPEALTRKLVDISKKRIERGKDKVLFNTPAELVPFIQTGGAYSIEKAEKLLGFNPEYSNVEAWSYAYDWFFSQDKKERFNIYFKYRV
jgi:nucleoside-diphosphate-sugar epimerase